jgi:phosphotransacetylase
VNFFRHRALKNHRIYLANQGIINSIDNYFDQDTACRDTTACYEMFDAFYRYYYALDSGDPFINKAVYRVLERYDKLLPEDRSYSYYINRIQSQSNYHTWNMVQDSTYLRRAYECECRMVADSTLPMKLAARAYLNSSITLLLKNHILTYDEYRKNIERLREFVGRKEFEKEMPDNLAEECRKQLDDADENFIFDVYFGDTTVLKRSVADSMMVETGDADAFITGLYTKYSNTIKVAKEVVGIREGNSTFGTMHIINSPKGILYLGDTLVNGDPTTDDLVAIAKLAAHTVDFFNETPNIAMISYSNFGSDKAPGSQKVKDAVARLHQEEPELCVDGEMQIGSALNRQLRDDLYPFSKLAGKDCNTLVFPNLTSARSAYKLLQMLSNDVEIIGPVQMGLNKPIHFTDSESSVRDVVNITAIASLDAYVEKIKGGRK